MTAWLHGQEQNKAKLDPVPVTNIRIVENQSERNLLISYNTQLLQEICSRSKTAIKYLGEKAAISLQARHSDIQAANNVFELPFGKVKIEGNHCTLLVPDILAIKLAPNYTVPENGALYDWSTVGRVKVMAVNDVE